MQRLCVSCSRYLPLDHFSATQARQPPNLALCLSCQPDGSARVSSTPSTAPSTPSTPSQKRKAPPSVASSSTSSSSIPSARLNNSTRASFTKDALANPFADGAFRWVALGFYLDGPRRNERCVCKWFKSGSVFSRDFFTHDVKAVHKAVEIVDNFNKLVIVDRLVKVNVPEVWQFEKNAGNQWDGSMSLIEPYISNYTKFNSNTVRLQAKPLLRSSGEHG